MLSLRHSGLRYNKTYLGAFFSDQQLWEMVTTTAVKITATDSKLGSLATGHLANIAIFAGHNMTPFRAVTTAAGAGRRARGRSAHWVMASPTRPTARRRSIRFARLTMECRAMPITTALVMRAIRAARPEHSVHVVIARF